MPDYGESDRYSPDINTRADPYTALPPFGGHGKPTKSPFKKYAKGKGGKYRVKDEKKKEVAEKMSAYTMGTWKKKGGKWKKIYDFGKAPHPKGPQKAASHDSGVSVENWLRKDWPHKK